MNLEETEDMARFILDIQDELGITMILVDHDMGLVMDIADRVMVLDFGRKIAEGLPQEVQTNIDVIKAYLGTTGDGPDANWSRLSQVAGLRTLSRGWGDWERL